MFEEPGRTAEDIVDRWFSHEDDRPKALARARQRMSRARRGGIREEREPLDPVPVSGDNREPGSAPVRPPADFATARLDRVPFLELMLAEALADLQWTREVNPGRAGPLVTVVLNVREELDRARAERGAVVQLERSPGAVALEMEKRQKALAILAEAQRAAIKEAAPQVPREREL